MTTEKKVVLAALLVTFAATAARTIPRVVTGVSVFSVVQLAAFVAILAALWRRRREIAAWRRRDPLSGHVSILAAIGLVALGLLLFVAIRGEVVAGRHYDRIAKDLESTKPTAALALAGDLTVEKSGPLCVRILERLARLESSDHDVIVAVRNRIREASDRSVRDAAVRTFGALMTEQELIDTVADLPHLKPPQREPFLQALRLSAGRAAPTDMAGWRKYVSRRVEAGAGETGFRDALHALRVLGEDRHVREAALARLASGEGAKVSKLLPLLRERDSALRAAAGKAISKVGRTFDAVALGDALNRERNPATAAVLAAGILRLDRKDGIRRLEKLRKKGRTAAARKAAAAVLTRAGVGTGSGGK